MRKLREVLRLRFELKPGYQQIGRSCAIAVSTVHKYLKRAEATGLSWPLPEDWDEARMEAAVFPRLTPPVEPQPARTPPDFAAIHEQLRGNKYVTLQLLWEEYRQANPDGYRYSRFCELYQRWRSKLDVVLRQEHKAGEKMFVDWADEPDFGVRPAHRHCVASFLVRRRTGCEQLHLGRGDARPADGSVAVRPRACPQALRRHPGDRGSR